MVHGRDLDKKGCGCWIGVWELLLEYLADANEPYWVIRDNHGIEQIGIEQVGEHATGDQLHRAPILSCCPWRSPRLKPWQKFAF